MTRQSIALTVEDDVGVPQPVDVSGEIAGGTFVGNIAIADLGVPFSAAVD